MVENSRTHWKASGFDNVWVSSIDHSYVLCMTKSLWFTVDPRLTSFGSRDFPYLITECAPLEDGQDLDYSKKQRPYGGRDTDATNLFDRVLYKFNEAKSRRSETSQKCSIATLLS